MMKSMAGTAENTTKKQPSTPHEPENPQTEDSMSADIMSHMLSVGAAQEKSINPNYKLSLEVRPYFICFHKMTNTFY